MSPFKSKAQARYMFAKKPEIAKEFADKTDFKKIPEKVGKKGKPPQKFAMTLKGFSHK